jgi:drug/metabolite transporter (DMT)-like permease
MGAFALALFSGMCWGSADFFGGLFTRRLAVTLVMVVAQGTGLVLTGLLILVLDESPPATGSLLYGALGGVAGAVGLAALYQGLAIGPMSIVAPAASLSVTVPVITGFLHGDRPMPLQVAGIACAVTGIVLAARAPDPDGASGRVRATGLLLAFIAAAFLGLLVVCLDASGAESAAWAAFMVRLTSVPLFLIALVASRQRGPAPTARDTGALMGIGVLDNAANLTFALASQTGLLSLVAVLGSLYPVSTVLLARGFLHERLTRHQWIGVITAFVGVALIAAG